MVARAGRPPPQLHEVPGGVKMQSGPDTMAGRSARDLQQPKYGAMHGSTSNVHVGCPAGRRYTGTAKGLNGLVERVRDVVQIHLVSLENTAVEVLGYLRAVLVAH
jgi:hypothetical protein